MLQDVSFGVYTELMIGRPFANILYRPLRRGCRMMLACNLAMGAPLVLFLQCAHVLMAGRIGRFA